ncbi:hypothetical protein [Nocardia sp. IFM 10818]
MESTRQRRAWDIASYGFGLGELLGANHRHLTVDALGLSRSLSAMPAMDTAIDNIHRALKPGGLLMVWDVNPKGPFRLLYRTLAGAPGVDVSQRIRRRFDDVYMLDGKARRIAWRSPSPWFLLLLARKAGRTTPPTARPSTISRSPAAARMTPFSSGGGR